MTTALIVYNVGAFVLWPFFIWAAVHAQNVNWGKSAHRPGVRDRAGMVALGGLLALIWPISVVWFAQRVIRSAKGGAR